MIKNKNQTALPIMNISRADFGTASRLNETSRLTVNA